MKYSKEQVNSQMNVLNADYQPTGSKFVLAGVDYTINQDWFMNGGPQTFGFPFAPFCLANPIPAYDRTQQTQMKAKLRIGGAADLNLYSVK